MKAIGYVRVSTEEQASSGLGLEAQRAAIAAAATRLGLELGPVFADEGLSGSLAPHERPGLTDALAELGKGETLLVAKRDRLGRDRLEVGLLERALEKRRCRVVSAAGEGTEADDPSARLQRGVIDLFAEHERNVTIARTKAALRAKRARGERTGGVPFGYQLGPDDKLAELEHEQRALAFMRERSAAGDSPGRIARALHDRGFKPRGQLWYPQSVRTILETDARRKGEKR